MSVFTKGPWHIHWGLKYASIRNREGLYVLEPTPSGSQVRYVADAHLIAAAPDLAMIVEEYFKSGCKCDEMPGIQVCALCQKASNVLEKLGVL